MLRSEATPSTNARYGAIINVLVCVALHCVQDAVLGLRAINVSSYPLRANLVPTSSLLKKVNILELKT
jgi:hypothetical protein